MPRLATQYVHSRQPPRPDFVDVPPRRYTPPPGHGLSAPFVRDGGIVLRYVAPLDHLDHLDAVSRREAEERAKAARPYLTDFTE